MIFLIIILNLKSNSNIDIVNHHKYFHFLKIYPFRFYQISPYIHSKFSCFNWWIDNKFCKILSSIDDQFLGMIVYKLAMILLIYHIEELLLLMSSTLQTILINTLQLLFMMNSMLFLVLLKWLNFLNQQR